jgi:hypothetical protein
MKRARLFSIVTGSLLLVGLICHAEDPKGPSAGVGSNNKTENRPPRVPVSLQPASRNLRNHGAAPATIGGPATKSKNAAVIDGTGMKRR